MELYSRKINIWLLQRFVLIVHCIAKRLKEMAGHICLQFLPTRVCCKCLGQEENVGTLFDELKFSSFHPLSSLLPEKTLHYNSPGFLSILVVWHQGLLGERAEEYLYPHKGTVSEIAGSLPAPILLFSLSVDKPVFVGSHIVLSWKIFLFPL